MKYVLMFLTFLSVCTTADLLKIPLTLDGSRTITIPNGTTSFDESFTINPADDADFQKYLDKIKGYEIESISITPESWSGAQATKFSGTFSLPDLNNISVPITNLDLGTVSLLAMNISSADLVSIATSLQQFGKLNVRFKGTLTNNSGGSLKLGIKVNLKIKVV